mgnify:CR=1 FL=1
MPNLDRSRGVLRNRLDFFEVFADLFFRDPDIVRGLKVEPKLRRRFESLGEAQGRVGSDADLFIGDPFEPGAGNAAGFRKLAGRQVERNKKFFAENFAGMHGRKLSSHDYTLHGFSGSR